MIYESDHPDKEPEVNQKMCWNCKFKGSRAHGKCCGCNVYSNWQPIQPESPKEPEVYDGRNIESRVSALEVQVKWLLENKKIEVKSE